MSIFRFPLIYASKNEVRLSKVEKGDCRSTHFKSKLFVKCQKAFVVLIEISDMCFSFSYIFSTTGYVVGVVVTLTRLCASSIIDILPYVALIYPHHLVYCDQNVSNYFTLLRVCHRQT